MITGSVSTDRAVVTLLVRSPARQGELRDFLLDTGFDGFLSLPAADIAALALPFGYQMPATYADGSVSLGDVQEAAVKWENAELIVDVLATGHERLLGMMLLRGHEIRIRVEDGGFVEIARIPP